MYWQLEIVIVYLDLNSLKPFAGVLDDKVQKILEKKLARTTIADIECLDQDSVVEESVEQLDY